MLVLLLLLYYIDAWYYLGYGESTACVEGEGCVDQVGVYDKPGASLAMGCYLGTPGMDTCGG